VPALQVRLLTAQCGGDEAAALEAVYALGRTPPSMVGSRADGAGDGRAEEEAALAHKGCRGLCRVCGHPCGSRQHGPRGCTACGPPAALRAARP
jgi:hypothetical protein